MPINHSPLVKDRKHLATSAKINTLKQMYCFDGTIANPSIECYSSDNFR